MKRQIVAGALAALAFILVLAGVKALQISKAIAQAKARQVPPMAVTSVKALKEIWPLEFSAVGELAPVQGVVLAAEEAGQVASILFEPGSNVEKGAVLVELDADVEKAQLQSAKASFKLAELDFKRQQSLRRNGANAAADLEKAEAAYQAAKAEVLHLEAMLERKKVVAPFRGRTGARLVNEGQVITAGTPVVSLQDLDKLYLNFSLPQRFIGQIVPGLPVVFQVDAFPGRNFRGSVTTIEPAVDKKTRNIGLQALVRNPDGLLYPGMFASALVTLAQKEEVVSLPASSINFDPFGNSVYVIERQKGGSGEPYLGVRQQPVKLGRRRGDLVAVTAGLEGGEEVVSSGAFKLHPEAAVIVNNDIVPGAEVSPQPENS